MSSQNLPGITFHEPFGYLDYNKLQLEAKCVLSDSGTISEESAIMQFPAVCLRPANERPEAIRQGVAILAGVDAASVVPIIKYVLSAPTSRKSPEGYESPDFSEQVISVLFSTCVQFRALKGLNI
jgi:UDP-N-acetyl-L-fucosamine synthase